MTRDPPPRALLHVLAALLLAALFAIGVLRGVDATINDNDELWHLAAGRAIVETGHVPDRDPFSFTAGETPWTNTNWLAQVVLYRVFQLGGIEADWLLGTALFLAALGVALALAGRRARSAWAVLPVAYLVVRVLRTGSTVRPQGWTFFLMALTLLLVERVRERGRTPAALALGVVLALLAQLHGGFVFAFAAVGLALLGEAWDAARATPSPETPGWRAVAWLGVALLVGVAGFAVHPHGFEALWHPARYALDVRLREMGAMTQELAPPDFSQPVGLLTEIAVLGALGLCLAGRPRLRTGEALATLAFAHLALTSTRGLHYLALVLAGPLAAGVDALLLAGRLGAPRILARRLETLERLEPAARTFVRRAPWALAASFLATAAAFAPRLAPGRPGDASSSLLARHQDAVAVARLLAERDPPGRTWNELETGGVFVWTLWPKRPVFIDGRGDFYARAGVWRELTTVLHAIDGEWQPILSRRGCDTAVATKGQRIERALRRSWRVVREFEGKDRTLVLFARPGTPADRALAGP